MTDFDELYDTVLDEVRADIALGPLIGIEATPTYVVNGVVNQRGAAAEHPRRGDCASSSSSPPKRNRRRERLAGLVATGSRGCPPTTPRTRHEAVGSPARADSGPAAWTGRDGSSRLPLR